MTLKNGLKSRKCSFLFNEQQLEKVVEFRPPLSTLVPQEILREAFKNKNDETYGIFHMLVDPPPPTYGKSSVIFLLSKNDF